MNIKAARHCKFGQTWMTKEKEGSPPVHLQMCFSFEITAPNSHMSREKNIHAIYGSLCIDFSCFSLSTKITFFYAL